MSDVLKLSTTDDLTSITLSPLVGSYEQPDMAFREINTLKRGNTVFYQYDIWLAYSFNINNINVTNYGYIVSWWQNGTKLKFFPDYSDSPDYYITVRIINDTCPLSMMFPYWREIYEGELQLRECAEI